MVPAVRLLRGRGRGRGMVDAAVGVVVFGSIPAATSTMPRPIFTPAASPSLLS